MNPKRIFVDMDGVIAKWEDASIEEVATKGYFTGCEAEEKLIAALHRLAEANYDVKILSAVFQDNHSAADKKQWLSKHCPFIQEKDMLFVPYGEDKSSFIEAPADTDILLDDFSKNLRTWHGIGIKVYNGINGTHGTWCGYSIHTNMEKELLYKQLKAIIDIA